MSFSQATKKVKIKAHPNNPPKGRENGTLNALDEIICFFFTVLNSSH
jgi:hypothetical protein